MEPKLKRNIFVISIFCIASPILYFLGDTFAYDANMVYIQNNEPNENETEIQELSLSDLSLIPIQSIIDKYIHKLSIINDYNTVPLNIKINKNLDFQHLSINSILSALSNHNIFIGGDSTIENTILFIYWILNKYLVENKTNYTIFNFDKKLSLIIPFKNNSNKNLYPELLSMKFRIQLLCNNNSYYKCLKNNYNETINNVIGWFINYQHYKNYNLTIYSQKTHKCSYYPNNYYLNKYPFIDIIITNLDVFFCTHLFTPNIKYHNNDNDDNRHSPVRFTRELKPDKVKNNINLENNLNNFLQDAINKDIKCVILISPNSICDEYYFNSWAKARDLWNKSINDINDGILNSCLNAIGGYNKNDLIIDNSNTSGFTMNGFEFCKYSTLTFYGMEYLNNRIFKWINYTQNKFDLNKSINTKLLYINQWKVTHNRCKYTHDGRHYPQLLPLKAELIVNVVDKFCR